MKLDEYRQKRDATRTNEPLGDEPARRSGPTLRGAFVVHQHDATGMHWDLRLEVGGVLASFAIPHGITLDPDARNLAMHTEDHPIEYLDFEAVIPEGTYGAGPMIVWDYGAVRYLEVSAEEGLATGKLHFALEGRKLRGRFGLVRMKPKGAGRSAAEPKAWLLLKKRDEFADASRDLVKELPRSVFSGLTVSELASAPRIAAEIEAEAEAAGAPLIKKRSTTKLEPMLCAAGPLPVGAGWLYELKLDGVRILARKEERSVHLRYRSQRDATPAYPEVERAIAALGPRHLLLDGEVVAFDEQGRPSFTRLASRIHGAGSRFDLRAAMASTPVSFLAFDLLEIGARDLRPLPLVERKRLLGKLIPAPGTLRVLDHLEGGGEELLAFCRAKGLEGVVSKKARSPYREGGKRSGDWVKTKCEKRDDFVVVGYTVGETTRAELGALEVASFEGEELVLRGRVGSGLDEQSIAVLLEKLRPLATQRPTARGEYSSAPKGRTHVTPEVVVSVRYLEWSLDGNLRFPVYLGIQPDRDIHTCTVVPRWGDAEVEPALELAHETGFDPSAGDAAGAERDAAPPGSIRAPASTRAHDARVKPEVTFTNRNKLYWPEDGITKGELVDYYIAIAPWLLPYLADRPVMLVRYPDGIHGKHFYQWNVPHGMPAWVRSVSLGKHSFAPVDDDAHEKNVFLVDRTESLAYIANLGCIPIHVLGSRVDAPDTADYLVVDFDVGRSTLSNAVILAKLLREVCDELGLPAFPKTSGQSGLHVFVSLGPGTTPGASRTLADLLGRILTEAHPSIATMERAVSRRGTGKVYVDTGQTGASRTIVAPWSVRATPGARVSTPLLWDEVTEDLDPGRYTIRTVLERVRAGGDPMAPLLTNRPDMDVVMRNLASLLAKQHNPRSK